jgi:hypothetical protein
MLLVSASRHILQSPSEIQMANSVQVTKNKTLVLDPGADTAAMVVVYRGLGPEMGKSYAYDTAKWMMETIQKAIPQESLNKIIFAVPDDYNQDCESCIQQAKERIDQRKGKISSYSLCGFSKGGAPVYKNLSRRTWKILGLIDAVSPSMEGISDKVVDAYSSRIRCVYGVSHWGSPNSPPGSKEARVYKKTLDFHNHLQALKVDMIDATKQQGHRDMPEAFFKEYGSSFL